MRVRIFQAVPMIERQVIMQNTCCDILKFNKAYEKLTRYDIVKNKALRLLTNNANKRDLSRF